MLATCDDLVDDALARSVVYRFLSASFQPGAPPTADAVSAAASALRHCDGTGIGRAIAARLEAAPMPTAEEMLASFVRLFGHTARGVVCPYETEYGSDNAFHQPQQLADIAGTYLAFGLRPAASSRVDHIACECEFMDFLNRKEAVLAARAGRSADEQQTLEVTRETARLFLRDHLARFGRAFATRVVTEDAAGLFGLFGHVLLACLDGDCQRLGIDPGPTGMPLRPDVPDEAPMACDRCVRGTTL